MTRYLIDARGLQDGSAVRGIGTYVRGLLGGFSELGMAGEVELLTRRGRPLPAGVAEAGFTVARATVPIVKRRLQPLVDPLLIGRALRAEMPSLYHAVEYAQPLRPTTPVVVTVHDLVPFVLRDGYRWQRRERLLAVRQLRHADALIAVSQATADDVVRIAGVDRRRVTVVHHGIDQLPAADDAALAAVRARLRLPAQFVLAVGTFDPRKRIETVAEVVTRLRREYDVGLVIAGSQGSFQPQVQAAIAAAGLTDVTRLTGFVDPATLGALYQLARCLLYASAYEGFGLPPLEAMAAGTPALAFANSSLPEVVGAGGILVADGDSEAMAEAACELLEETPARRARIDAGRRWVARFTWRECAEQTRSVYRRVAQR